VVGRSIMMGPVVSITPLTLRGSFVRSIVADSPSGIMSSVAKPTANTDKIPPQQLPRATGRRRSSLVSGRLTTTTIMMTTLAAASGCTVGARSRAFSNIAWVATISGGFQQRRTISRQRRTQSWQSTSSTRTRTNGGVRLFGTDVVVSDVTEKMRLDSERELIEVAELYDSMTKKNAPSSSPSSLLPTVLASQKETLAFLRDAGIRTVLFDCDGVLYRSPDPAPGARECVTSLLSQKDAQVYFVTNNAGSNRKQLRDKLRSILQIDSLTEDMMISSSYSAAQYLKRHFEIVNDDSGVVRPSTPPPCLYVIGSEGLCEELRQTGFEVLGGPSSSSELSSMSRDELASYEFSEHPVDAVVVGHDTEMNFRKLSVANVLLQWNPDALLVATNLDSFDLVGGDGRHIPGNGATVAALEYCSKRTAINVGKPSKTLASLIKDIQRSNSGTELDFSTSLFVGDRLDTDIRFGLESGMYTALVLTGVTTADELRALGEGTEEEPLPSHVLPHVGWLAEEYQISK